TIVGHPVGTLLSLFRADAIADGTRIRWSLAPQFSTVSLESSPASLGPWTAVAGAQSISARLGVFDDRDASPDVSWFYRLKANDASGATQIFGPVASTNAVAPRRLEILSLSPNPSAGVMRVDFAIPRSAPVRLRILDVQGRVVATLLDGEQPAGRGQ